MIEVPPETAANMLQEGKLSEEAMPTIQKFWLSLHVYEWEEVILAKTKHTNSQYSSFKELLES